MMFVLSKKRYVLLTVNKAIMMPRELQKETNGYIVE